MAIRVTVWNEYLHEVQFEEIAAVYPKGIHGCIAEFLEKEGFEVKTATLVQPEHGLAQEVLDQTDVLIWWGHMAHQEVSDEVVAKVKTDKGVQTRLVNIDRDLLVIPNLAIHMDRTANEGKVLHQNADTATYNATLVKYADLICDRPIGQAKISVTASSQG